MMYWISCVICFVCGSGVCGYLFKRHYRRSDFLYQEQQSRLVEQEHQLELQREALEEQQRQLEIHKEALREIMRRTHHEDINPVAKRIRGLCTLGLMAAARTMNFLDLLSKPDHQGYSKLAMMEVTDSLDYLRKIESEALSLEKSTLDKVKEFEHLQ